MTQKRDSKDIQSELGSSSPSVKNTKGKRHEMIGSVARVLSMVVVCLISFSGCQDNQKAAPQPESSPISMKSEKVKQEKSLEFEQCRVAAELGDSEAQFELGKKYYYGIGVKQDHEQMEKWFRKAARQGHAEAQFELGHNKFSEGGDDIQAVQWYLKAAEQGHANAHCKLGHMFNMGMGVKQDHKLAVEWYRKAAKQGDESAKRALKNLGKLP